jgi:hypothetical protein
MAWRGIQKSACYAPPVLIASLMIWRSNLILLA